MDCETTIGRRRVSFFVPSVAKYTSGGPVQRFSCWLSLDEDRQFAGLDRSSALKPIRQFGTKASVEFIEHLPFPDANQFCLKDLNFHIAQGMIGSWPLTG
jgi:hypothetical protein